MKENEGDDAGRAEKDRVAEHERGIRDGMV